MESSADTLGRWMAHYVAELMDHAENSPPEELAVSKKRCFDAILDLWSHRAELPDGRRPFEDLEPIMTAIESLDPESDTPRYFPSIRHAVDETEEDPQTQSLLDVVRSIDSAARILIKETLADAALSAIERTREWVALAEQAGADSGVVDIVVRFVSGETDMDPSPDRNTHRPELLKERVERLEAFTELAKLLVEDLKMQLAQADRSVRNPRSTSDSESA